MSFGVVTPGGNTEPPPLEVLAVSEVADVSVAVAALLDTISSPLEVSAAVLVELVLCPVLVVWLVDVALVELVWALLVDVAAVVVDV
jgi:hypothetical protein